MLVNPTRPRHRAEIACHSGWRVCGKHYEFLPRDCERHRFHATNKNLLRRKANSLEISSCLVRTITPPKHPFRGADTCNEDKPMSIRQQIESSCSIQLSAGSVCNHCAGVTSHEPWCITCSAVVRYAYGLVLDRGQLTVGDELILHALGVEWSSEPYKRDGSRQ